MNRQQNTVSVTMKERQNHRKRKNIKVHVFQTKDIIFLLSLSCFIFQLPSSYGFKGLMPFPEGKKTLWNSPPIYNWFSVKYIQLTTFSVLYQTYLIFEEPYERIIFFYIYLISNSHDLIKIYVLISWMIVIYLLLQMKKDCEIHILSIKMHLSDFSSIIHIDHKSKTIQPSLAISTLQW